MDFHITGLFAAVFSLFFIILATMVTMRRAKIGVSLFHGDDEILAVRMRRHGNFAEVMPFVLILMALCEAQGAESLWLYAFGVVTFVARIIHAFGLEYKNGATAGRIGGGSLTQLAMLIAIGYLVFNFFA